MEERSETLRHSRYLVNTNRGKIPRSGWAIKKGPKPLSRADRDLLRVQFLVRFKVQFAVVGLDVLAELGREP